MEKYLPIIQDINKHLASFNKLLRSGLEIEPLDETLLADDNYYHSLIGKTWGQVRFPRNCGVGGVYFFFGSSVVNPNSHCLYIGKASLNSTTGKRLWAHFKTAFDENGHVIKNGNSGERFRIVAITLLPFELEELTCFAPALEEYLIIQMSKECKYDLVNVRGNG